MLFQLLSNPTPLTFLIFLLFAVGVIIAITVHEFAHAASAEKLGDPTAKVHNRVSLNPLNHLDPIGTLLIFLVGFGWGKPTPFDPYNLKNPKKDSAIISLAGPASNLILAVLFTIPFWIGAILQNSFLTSFSELLSPIVRINIILAIFNLIPIHPLDGFKILGGFLPREWYNDWMATERYGIILLIALLFIPIAGGSSLLSQIIGPVVGQILNLLYLGQIPF
ncbi:MAG TPA: site-2 protease family protein [Patescibacteria group bacterium]